VVESNGDPYWFKDAVIYELHPRAFFDSNADGVGDFAGLAQKLDYLKDLGVTAIWLLPFYPSPLLDDGYDIADYTSVHPSYGNLRDVRQFIREAHRRDLKVITELVCNHTSDQHPWFQRARRARPGSAARDFYVWSDTPDRYTDARIIFKDFESSNWSWDAVAGAYYWHRFYRHQPDLNYDNPRVREALIRVMDMWLDMGVDGLRLDAVPYLIEREGTNCENLPETYEILRELRAHIDANYEDRMLLAEANQWPEDAVAYFGDGDMCHMAFHFPLMPRLFMSIHMEDRFPIIDIVRQTPAIPDNCQWAIFLRNHDELTLEMVTDEERDYMYRVYAADQRMRINLGIRRRLAPLLGNHRRRMELMNGLLFSMPGTPVIYYGDEIGMGDNIYLGDRNGVRTPMQWSPDRNAGFSRANPQKLYLPVIIDPEYHYETVNVEAQTQNQHSLLWWTRRLIALRKRYRAFSRGTIEFLHPENRKVLAFIRRYEDEIILVVANLSRFAQGVSLDLGEFRGLVPIEMFGRVELPPVGEAPYFLTLGPHSFYWFSLEPQRVSPALSLRLSGEGEVPLRTVEESWQELVATDEDGVLAGVLPDFLLAQRWFAGKGRNVRSATIDEVVTVRRGARSFLLSFVGVQYTEGVSETYLLPLAYESGEAAFRRLHQQPESVLVRLRRPGADEGIVFDAIQDEEFSDAIVRGLIRRARVRAKNGDLVSSRLPFLRSLDLGEGLRATPIRAEQSNTSVNVNDRLLLKTYRKLEAGTNPDFEIGRYLTERGFPNTPRVAGAVEYQRPGEAPMTLAIVHEYIQNEGDAWQYSLDAVRDFFDRAQAEVQPVEAPAVVAEQLLPLRDQEPPVAIAEMVGAYLESARLLGRRTAELHAELADATLPDFAPESFTPHYQRGLFQSMRNLAGNSFALLAARVVEDDDMPPEAEEVLRLEEDVLRSFRRLVGLHLRSQRIRTHGDYHLGQVLFTGNDFMITDFEGEPSRSLTDRRLKRSPLRDVAGMLRSFSYAAQTAIRERVQSGLVADNGASLQPWGRLWQLWVSSAFLGAYLTRAREAGFFNADHDETAVLLDIYLLEKAVYELGYELNNRPDWVSVPLQGILDLLRVNA
jgi:maltose alpha-D-glucosyltransferase/alpha-amylase